MRTLALGLTLILTCLALVATAGQSIFLGFLWLFVTFWLEKRYFSNPSPVLGFSAYWRSVWRNSLQDVVFLTVSSFLLVAWFYFMHFQNGEIANIYSDYAFYAKVAFGLEKYGIENVYHSLNGISNIYHVQNEYHYYELWLNVLFAKWVERPHLHIFFSLTFPFLLVIVLQGFQELIRERFSVMLWPVFLSIAVLFFGGLFHDAFGDYLPLVKKYWLHFYPLRHMTEKQIPALLFFFLSLQALRIGHIKEAMFWCMGTSVATYTALPSVMGGVLFFVVVGTLSKKIDWAMASRILIIWLGLLLFLILFYKLQSTGFTEKSVNTSLSASDLLSMESILKRFKFVVGTSLRLSILFMPIICLSMIYWLRNGWRWPANFMVECLLLGCALGGLVGAALFINTLNSLQLAYYPISCLLVAWSYLVLTEILETKHTWVRYLALAIFFLTAVANFSLEFVYRHVAIYSPKIKDESFKNRLKKLITSKNLSPYGASIRNPAVYLSPYEKPVNVYTVGMELQKYTDEIVTISINDLNVPISDDPVLRPQEEGYVTSGAFYQFCDSLKQKGAFKNEAESQLIFCKQHKMNFAIVEKGAKLPESLQTFVKEKHYDKAHAYTLYLLNLEQ